ncbi:MAG TPA: TetR/AcrR family transcriptional regulator [Solirubrobacterales bacterium]|nr:TetR/AcrR family transcriptional regulator [Solirubrobacterales bacterium]
MLTAAAAALGEHGYAGTTVAKVLEGAGVSRRTFYEQFADKDDCLLVAYDDAERRMWAKVVAAVAGEPPGDWPRQVHTAVGAAMDFLAAEPTTARLFTLEARTLAPLAKRQHGAAERIAAILRSGNRGRSDSDDLPEATERTLVGNVVALAGSYVLSGAAELLPSLTTQLADHLLLTYREAGAAAEMRSAATRGPK